MRKPTLMVLLSALTLMALSPPAPVAAQQTQKRSEVELMPVEPPPAELPPQPWGLFDTHLTLELGGQIANIHGNKEAYRSHLNYADGFRVFSFNFRGKGQEGAFLTDFYAQGAGWGGDPSNWVRWGVSKDKWFDLRASYRRNDYFFAIPGFARNLHRNDQQRRLQRYALTILPKRPLRFRLGYSRNSSFTESAGMTVTSTDVEGTRELFFFFEPLRQTFDEYRLGVEWHPQRWNFFLEQSYRFFRNDRSIFLPEIFNVANPAEGSAGAADPAAVNDQFRDFPIRGRIPVTRLTISGRPHKTLEAVGRIVYSRPMTNYSRFEFVDGVGFTGAPLTNTFNSFGNVRRPMTRGDLGVTWRPVPKFTLSETFRFHRYDIAGGDFTTIVGTLADVLDDDRLLSVDTFENRIEGRYDFTRWLGVRAGFDFTHRDITHAEFEDGILDDEEELNTNNRVFLLGFRLRPQRTLSVYFDYERGNYTGVFTRISAANIDRIRLRGRWEPVSGARLAASWFVFDNSNSNLPTTFNPNGVHESRNRGFSVDFQVTRFQRGYLNLGYSRNDVTTNTDVILPRFGPPNGGISSYFLNDNYAYIDFGGHITGNLYGDAGYRVVFTTGTFPPSDPVGACTPFFGPCDNAGGLAPLAINPFETGGLNYHQPHAALRYVFSDNLSWKAGWRWYGYNVKHGTLSDYKSHIITSSLALTF